MIIFLPYEDHFPKAFIHRSWYLNDRDRPKLFPRFAKANWPEQSAQTITKGPNQSGEIRPSIWLNDQIIGRWELEKDKTEYKIVMSLCRDISKSLHCSIMEKKAELEQFINEQLIQISSSKNKCGC